MKITRDQAHALANQIKHDASALINADYDKRITSIRPTATKEAKKVMAILSKLPEWAKKSIKTYGYGDGLTEGYFINSFIDKQKLKKREVRSDIYDQVVSLSIDCKTVDEIKRKVKVHQ